MAQSLTSLSYNFWSDKTDGGHRHSTEEWLEAYASELIDMLPLGGTLLDIGCGSCQTTSYLARKMRHVYAVDFSASMAAAARRRIDGLGIKNIQLLLGTATEFPTEVQKVDIVLSYEVLQYLSYADVGQHLDECRRVLNEGGCVCIANIPDHKLRNLFYSRRLFPRHGGYLARLKQSVQFARQRAKAFVKRDHFWDGIGNWFERAKLEKVAREAGFSVEFRNASFYEYRFHALLRPISSEARHSRAGSRKANLVP